MLRTTLFTSIVIALAGCAAPLPEFIENTNDNAQITFTTRAPNWVVNIDLSKSETACKDFTSVGNLFYDAQMRGGGFFGTIQKLNPIKPNENLEITRSIPAVRNFQVRTYARTSGGYNATCGPLVAMFDTQADKKYEVNILLERGLCRLEISDISNAEVKQPIKATKYNYC